MALNCKAMKCPNISYQKCIAILRVTLLRNHMSVGLIFVTCNLTRFSERYLPSNMKSAFPGWPVCYHPSRACLACERMHPSTAPKKPSPHLKIPYTNPGPPACTTQQRTLSLTSLYRSDLFLFKPTMVRTRRKK